MSYEEFYQNRAAKMIDVLDVKGFDENALCASMATKSKPFQLRFTKLCFAWIAYCATSESLENMDHRKHASYNLCDKVRKACRNVIFRKDV